MIVFLDFLKVLKKLAFESFNCTQSVCANAEAVRLVNKEGRFTKTASVFKNPYHQVFSVFIAIGHFYSPFKNLMEVQGSNLFHKISCSFRCFFATTSQAKSNLYQYTFFLKLYAFINDANISSLEYSACGYYWFS